VLPATPRRGPPRPPPVRRLHPPAPRPGPLLLRSRRQALRTRPAPRWPVTSSRPDLAVALILRVLVRLGLVLDVGCPATTPKPSGLPAGPAHGLTPRGPRSRWRSHRPCPRRASGFLRVSARSCRLSLSESTRLVTAAAAAPLAASSSSPRTVIDDLGYLGPERAGDIGLAEGTWFPAAAAAGPSFGRASSWPLRGPASWPGASCAADRGCSPHRALLRSVRRLSSQEPLPEGSSCLPPLTVAFLAPRNRRSLPSPGRLGPKQEMPRNESAIAGCLGSRSRASWRITRSAHPKGKLGFSFKHQVSCSHAALMSIRKRFAHVK